MTFLLLCSVICISDVQIVYVTYVVVFSTAKYSFFSFFVKFPYEQFRRYANCFFLFIALMQVSAFLWYNLAYFFCRLGQYG